MVWILVAAAFQSFSNIFVEILTHCCPIFSLLFVQILKFICPNSDMQLSKFSLTCTVESCKWFGFWLLLLFQPFSNIFVEILNQFCPILNFHLCKFWSVFVPILKCICLSFLWLAQWRVTHGLDFGCRCFPTSQQQSYSWSRCIQTHGDIVLSSKSPFRNFERYTPKKFLLWFHDFYINGTWSLIISSFESLQIDS